MPRAAGAQDGIEDREELARTGDHGDLLEFSCGDEPEVHGPECRVEASTDECGHVEHGADRGSPTPNRTASSQRAAVAVEGGDADQSGDLLAGEGAELWQESDHGSGGDTADGWHALQQVRLLAPDGRLLDRLLEVVLVDVELLLQPFDRGLYLLPDATVLDGQDAVLLGSDHLDQLTP